MKKTLLISILVLFISASFAQIPDGYYDNATGTGNALRMQLRNIIDGQQNNSYDALYDYYQTTDNHPNGKVWDMYSIHSDEVNADYWFTHITDKCSSGYNSEGDCYNREHSVPESWMGTGGNIADADLFIVVPTDGYVNNRRSSYPFGEVGSATWTSSNGSKVGGSDYPGYSSTVFEPIDIYKGDFARAYFYVVTRYNVTDWGGASFEGDGFSTWTLNMLLEWNALDPVSQKEIDRNNAVYDIQHNRNPYIDHPEWVCEVFGGSCGINDPTDFNATSDYNEIDLTWNLNNDNDSVILAYSMTNNFGTPSGSYTTGQTISGGGEVLYTGNNTNYAHSVSTSETYYYKLWSHNGTNYSNGVTTSATPLLPEPSENATNFHISDVTSESISVDWTDAGGTTPPYAYLIRMGTDLESIQSPIDGTTYPDISTQKNILQGIETVTFNGLNPGTEYFFKIFSYSNSGSSIDYNPDDTQNTNATTLSYTVPDIFISEIATKGYNATYQNEYIELSNTSSSSLDLTDWTLEYYESSTLEANLDLTGSIGANSAYIIAVRTNYNAITPDFIPTTGFSLNNSCHLILKQNGTTKDVAGNATSQFEDGSNYEFSNCTDDNEVVANWDNLLAENGTPGEVNCSDLVYNISNLTVNCENHESEISWTNPDNFDEIIIVANTSYISGIPTGTYVANSTNYTDNLNPDFPDGGKVVYNGTVSPQTVTGLDNNTYYFKIFTRLGENWSTGQITSCSIADIADISTDNFTIYPNPSSNGILNIRSNIPQEAQILIYDINGKIITSKTIDTQINTIDISNAGNGIFFIEIETENSINWGKIIIQ